jgi:serine/threonine-protein kinase
VGDPLASAGHVAEVQAAFAGRYTIERELGRGAMATVYLAHDRKHDRRVALKIISTELAHAVRTERFLREIAIVARLNHPHIAPLFDSGAAAGFLYYVMPHMAGESLRELLIREGRLPVAEAVRIAREVADALNHAHRHGVIHRDIKPGNILLEDGHAVVADFGIARAIAGESTDVVTETGVSLGTPAYMSPEQAAGGHPIDGRTDIYALGCVLYEMLAGRPPFVGPNAQAVLAQHLTGPVPPLQARRPEVSHGVELVTLRALAKTPEARYASAADFAAALATPEHYSLQNVRLRSRGRRVKLVGSAIVILAAAAVATARSLVPRSDAVDADIVVILPFRVAGTDPTLGFLREGMVDLLSAKLSGRSTITARDAQTTLSAWRRTVGANHRDLEERAAIDLARRLGGGRLAIGTVVGNPSRLVLSASLLGIPQGERRATGSVSGPLDSLTVLVDRLTAELLARDAGEHETRLVDLTTRSPYALQAYLAGKEAVRSGRLSDAALRFDEALSLDSTFALAAMELSWWGIWAQRSEAAQHGRRLAWIHRGQLSARDRALLEPRMFGFTYPYGVRSVAEQLAAWEGAARVAPDRAEEWFGLGNQLWLTGRLLRGVRDPLARARAAYRRAVELDSSFAPAVGRLVEATTLSGDRVQAEALLEHYLALQPASDLVDVVRWRVAVTFGDGVALRTLRERFDQIPNASLRRILGAAQLDGLGLEDAERAAHLLRSAPAAGRGQWGNYEALHHFALNRGRPGLAVELSREATRSERLPNQALAMLVLDALFWDGDSTVAADAARRLAKVVRPSPLTLDARSGEYLGIGAFQLWWLMHGRPLTGQPVEAQAAARRLRAAAGSDDPAAVPRLAAAWVVLLDAVDAEEDNTGAGETILRLDSIVATGGFAGDRGEYLGAVARLVLARLRERQGEIKEALAVTRQRRSYDWQGQGTAMLSTFLREEGRLAALAGNREGAIVAYRRYLALRSDPEPAVHDAVERVRIELARLHAEPRNR